jgi:hypothetical protein
MKGKRNKKKIIPKKKLIKKKLKVVKKARKKKVSKNYFTQETENAIVRYNSETDPIVRNKIYNESIRYPFEKLVENMINTFKFTYFEESKADIQARTVSFLVEKLSKYEAGKGKAFSYFGQIAKNNLILINNTVYKKLKSHDRIDAVNVNMHQDSELKDMSIGINETNSDTQEFISMMIAFWDRYAINVFKKQRDVMIVTVLMELFKRTQSIENFNKKAIYLYLREMTGFRTQYITKVINKLVPYYSKMISSYYDTGMLIPERILQKSDL